MIDPALRGEGVIVTRHGTPVVELRALRPAPPPVDDTDIARLAARGVPARDAVETPSGSLAALRDEDAG